jgi:hypothetical protein
VTIDHHTGTEEALFRALNSDDGCLLDARSVIRSASWLGVIVAPGVADPHLEPGGHIVRRYPVSRFTA